MLWRDQDSVSAANNLYRTIHALRQTLDNALGAGSANAIFAFEDGVFILDHSIWVDAYEFEKLASNRNSPIASLQSRVPQLGFCA